MGLAGFDSKSGTVKSYAGGLVYPLLATGKTLTSANAPITTCAKIDTNEMTLTGNFLKSGGQDWWLRASQIYFFSSYVGPLVSGADGIPYTADDVLTIDLFPYRVGAKGNDVTYLSIDNTSGANVWENPDDLDAKVEFSSVPIVDYQNDTCNDDEDADTVSDWVTDPTADPARFPDGWSSVTRYRLSGTFGENTDVNLSRSLMLFPELRINPSLDPAAGLGFGNVSEPDAFVGIYSSAIDRANGNSTWTHGPIASGTNNPFDGNTSDRVELVAAQLRVSKTITEPIETNEVVPGDEIKYSLSSTLAGALGGSTEILVDDTMDSNLEYKPNSTVIVPGSSGILVNGIDPTVNPNIEPVILGQNLKWTFSNVSTGDALPTIKYGSRVSLEATGGKLGNTVVISETGIKLDSTSSVSERTSSAVVALSPPGDFDVVKLLTDATNTTVELDEDLLFDLTYANTSSTEDIHNLEFIEVFPFNGDGPRDPVSGFSDDDNKLEFVSISGSLGGEEYLYTSAVPSSISNDPCHVSNTGVGDPAPVVCPDGFVDSGGNSAPSATGTTAWYDCSGGFGVGPCPIAKSAVTAIKMILDEPAPGTAALVAGSSREKFSLVLSPLGNKSGDVYTNNFGSRISESELVAVSNDVSVSVVDSSLGDRLWFDLNGDGVQDVGEPGISGVVVNLYDSLNVLVDSDVTDANGNYKFDKLVSGDYSVRVDSTTLPNGLSGTFDKDGLGTLDRADGSLVENVDDVSYDFGYRGVGSVSGRLWNDVDADGVQDPGEAGFSNFVVTVTYFGLDGVRGGTDDVAFTTTTDTNGDYSLTGLPLGNYSISVTPPSGFDQTFEFDDSFNNSLLFSLSGTSPSVVNQDFGYAKSSEVGGISTPSSGVLSRTGVQVFGVVFMALLLIMSGLLLARRKKTT